MIRKVLQTADGSSTVLIEDSDVTYHSRHGSIQESKHVFIDAGLKFIINEANKIKLLEIGFGTGLNLLLSIKELENYPEKKLFYHSIEKYPLENEVIEALDFPGYDNKLLKLLHQKITGKISNCEWQIYHSDLLQFETSIKFNLIYFDAFAPNFQPELWTVAVFRKLYQMLEKDGILVTYCAKGQVKRNLKEAGFTLESIPGPIGKREMTRAKA
jgi:tRNA U34 5-methylaminomethyl-2-thiouridine-forming methyltransferase MnmC